MCIIISSDIMAQGRGILILNGIQDSWCYSAMETKHENAIQYKWFYNLPSWFKAET